MAAILTGKKFREMGEAVWGPTWPTRIALKLGKTTKTMQRWADDGPPASERAAIEAAIEDQLALVARYHEELTADSDAF